MKDELKHVELLRIPRTFHTVKEVLEVAKQLDLPNCIIISEMASGHLVFLETEMSVASANYLLDRLKALLITPSIFEDAGL